MSEPGFWKKWIDRLVQTGVWKSIVRHGAPDSPSARSKIIRSNVLLHLHPVRLSRGAVRFRFTWCLGGLTAFFFLVELITGVLLMFVFRPDPAHAWNDLLAMRNDLAFGWVREMHRWGSHAVVICVLLHMLRVFLTGSYKPPREFNWVVGVVLLVLTLLISFTGYVVTWDQAGLWALTVGTNIAGAAPVIGSEGPLSMLDASSDLRAFLLGGTQPGAGALLRFYVLHCLALPVMALLLMALHFWRIRKDGGISGPL